MDELALHEEGLRQPVNHCASDGGAAMHVAMMGGNWAYRCCSCRKLGDTSSSVEAARALWNRANPAEVAKCVQASSATA